MGKFNYNDGQQDGTVEETTAPRRDLRPATCGKTADTYQSDYIDEIELSIHLHSSEVLTGISERWGGAGKRATRTGKQRHAQLK